jgi:hypothetical protein
VNEDNAPESGWLGLSAGLRLDALCRRFEDAWQAGVSLRLEDYLAQADGAEQGVLLRQLLHLELEYRTRTGQTPTRQEHLRRVPHATASIDSLLSWLNTLASGTGTPTGLPRQRHPLPAGAQRGRSLPAGAKEVQR